MYNKLQVGTLGSVSLTKRCGPECQFDKGMWSREGQPGLKPQDVRGEEACSLVLRFHYQVLQLDGHDARHCVLSVTLVTSLME